MKKWKLVSSELIDVNKWVFLMQDSDQLVFEILSNGLWILMQNYG